MAGRVACRTECLKRDAARCENTFLPLFSHSELKQNEPLERSSVGLKFTVLSEVRAVCVHIKRVDREPHEADAAYAARVRALGRQPFPCRTCDECRKAYEGRLVGDFIAMKQTSQRCLVVLLTYNRTYLERAGRSLEVLKDIDLAKEDARRFIPGFRKMLRRLHPELKIEVSAFRVTEIAPHENEAPELEPVDRKAASLWDAVISSPYLRKFKRPRIGEPQTHHHLCLWFNVEWKDEERQRREPAQWRDSLIPHLRTDGYLYDHVWESKAEAKARGGRVRKLAMPWEWGFVSYSDARGGEGSYFAKYAVKCMKMRGDWHASHYEAWDEQRLLNYQNSEKTWRSIRRSPRQGYRYYQRQATLAAEAGLPPRLYFEFAPGGREGERRLAFDAGAGQHLWKEGGPFRRSVPVHGDMTLDENGRFVPSVTYKRVSPAFLLQKTGRQRAYLTAYDERWEALNGVDAKQPVAPVVRQKLDRSSGRVKQIVVYGLEEAREQVAKDDDRRAIAKRERYVGRLAFALSPIAKGVEGFERATLERRKARTRRRLESLGPLPTLAEVQKMRGSVAEELMFARRSVPVAAPDSAKHTFVNKASLIRDYERSFRRDVLWPLGVALADVDENTMMSVWQVRQFYAHHDQRIFRYCRNKVALCDFSDREVQEIADGIKASYWREARGVAPCFKPWRKGVMKAGIVCG